MLSGKSNTKKTGSKALKLLLPIVLVGLIGIGIFAAVTAGQLAKLPGMSFEDTLAYTTRDNDKAIITVRIISGGEASYQVYGSNAALLPKQEHVYEIGSLTKTFTTALLCKAIDEGKADLDAPIDTYLDLPQKDYYPTLKRLVTHTSGYQPHYMEGQMVSNFFRNQKNDFYGIDQAALINRIGKINLKDQDEPFQYSNFGFAVLGRVLSEIYQTDYAQLMNDFIAQELQLNNTHISDAQGDLSGYWHWKPRDAYLPAGALTSTIGDMLRYIQLHMGEELPYLAQSHQVLAHIDNAPSQYQQMGIHMDDVGMGWIMDRSGGFIWHNGGTSSFNSYAAFDQERQLGVVILSNLPPSYRIPATVMGAKLMAQLQQQADGQQ